MNIQGMIGFSLNGHRKMGTPLTLYWLLIRFIVLTWESKDKHETQGYVRD